MDASPAYRERLAPPWWMLAVLLLVVPAALLVFLPVNIAVGAAVAVGLYAAAVGALWLGAPVIEVRGGALRAGRATIDAALLGEPVALRGDDARAELGQRWDAAAHHVTSPWVRSLVRVPVVDEADPTPAWVMSSRRPEALATAIAASR